MEYTLSKLKNRLDTLNDETCAINDEKKKIDEYIRKKEIDNYKSIEETTLKIEQLQNQLGSDIPLTQEKEVNLRNILITIEDILCKIENDESTIILMYGIPIPQVEPYSININLTIDYNPAFHIIIKTKCSAVENIVRETLSQYDGLYEQFSEKENKFDTSLIRKWTKSRHGETDIKFNHKK